MTADFSLALVCDKFQSLVLLTVKLGSYLHYAEKAVILEHMLQKVFINRTCCINGNPQMSEKLCMWSAVTFFLFSLQSALLLSLSTCCVVYELFYLLIFW